MKETISRLREARGQVLAVIETSGKSDAETLHYVAQDLHLSIIELQRVQAAVDSFALTFEAFVKTLGKAIGIKHV